MREARPRGAEVVGRPAAACEQRLHDAERLGPAEGTHGVGERAAGLDGGGGAGQQARLESREARHVGCLPSPAEVRPRGERPEAAARRVQEDGVEGARPRRRQVERVRLDDRDAAAPRRARFSRSSPARASSTSTAVRAASGSRAASWPVLAPGAAQRSRKAAPGPVTPLAATIAAIWEPRDCGLTSPSRKARVGSSGGPL